MEDVIMALSQNETMSQGFSSAGVPQAVWLASRRPSGRPEASATKKLLQRLYWG
jgi:hypothetical protein